MKAFDKKTMKAEIKVLVAKQKLTKAQRKTVNLVGERTMEDWVAQMDVMDNKHHLRLMYATYGLMRGKAFSVTENRYPEETHPLKEFEQTIQRMLSSYEIEVPEVVEF